MKNRWGVGRSGAKRRAPLPPTPGIARDARRCRPEAGWATTLALDGRGLLIEGRGGKRRRQETTRHGTAFSRGGRGDAEDGREAPRSNAIAIQRSGSFFLELTTRTFNADRSLPSLCCRSSAFS